MNIAASTISRHTFYFDEWWASLKHGGLLIAPSKVSEFFHVQEITRLPFYVTDRLRRDVTRMQMGDETQIGSLLDTVLEHILGLEPEFWHKGASLNGRWTQRSLTGETLKPRRVWLEPNGGELPVFVEAVPKLGIGRGKRSVARVIEWLRKSKKAIALLTNGHQWRLIHAGTDYDAWCEWEIALWFEEGELSSQVLALRALLGRQSVAQPTTEQNAPLVAAIQASRQSQAELSEFLGERVRQAIELLIRESAEAIAELPKTGPQAVTNRHIYIAATRMIMRCVVILFAEARDLLPRNNPIYHNSYGIQGLREQLDRASGGRAMDRLRNGFSAWSRLLALFRLVYQGSAHEALPVPKYGGGLFAPGKMEAKDPVLRSLSAFERSTHTVSDATVYRILELLCRSRVKVRQGRSTTWVEAPVDFSDLSSEYIGILYEGLLDFELRQAMDNPIVFLNLGDQPALPLERLENMSDSALASLVEKLKQKASEEEEIEEEAEEEIEEETEEETVEATEIESDDRIQQVRDRTLKWAVRAVEAGKLVAKPRSKKPEALADYQKTVNATANALIARIVLPQEWFLVRWGGTRKGSGTFYTRPQLATPTVRRTLQRLLYHDIVPRSPKEIIALKICDPACGSGSFLIAALRYVVEALYESLFFHQWLAKEGDLIAVRLPKAAQPAWFADCVQDFPSGMDLDQQIGFMQARLKRFVVERCIYGVDINPLAVELAQMALWVETMDRSLPFEFLDHKLKVGNSIVGAWFDRFRDYPVMAWEREGGDKTHTKGKHFSKEVWTKAIREVKNKAVKPEMRSLLHNSRQLDLFENHLLEAPEETHNQAVQVFEQVHDVPLLPDFQAEQYRQIEETEAFQQLKWAFDCWCAIWFWQADRLEIAPTPQQIQNPLPEARSEVERLALEFQFFHWELGFPDVFARPQSGFDATIGNPPWEIQKPNSKEFFSNLDPLYRTYGKQEALTKQSEYFEQDPQVEQDWLNYCGRLKALSNWVKYAGSPFGSAESFGLCRGQENERLHQRWREQWLSREGYAEKNHPFIYQGSADINTYKLFLELSVSLLRSGGQMGMIVPSGIYSDKGSTALRSLFLSRCSWQWLFGFENRDGIFGAVDSRFKFCPVIVQKGGETNAIATAFMERSLSSWEVPEPRVLSYPRAQIERFSPNSKAILEIRSQRDLQVLEKMYANSILLGDDSAEGWGIRYAREFDMTGDSKLFPPRSIWEAKGYQPDEYGHWLKGEWKAYEGNGAIVDRPDGLILSANGDRAIHIDDIEDVALPLYQGVMVQQLDAYAAAYLSGAGNQAKWKPLDWNNKCIQPQFLMGLHSYQENSEFAGDVKIAFRDITNATNERTMISSGVLNFPCGNVLGILRLSSKFDSAAIGCLIACLTSFAYDAQARNRIGGTHLNWFVVEETAVLPAKKIPQTVGLLCARLLFPVYKAARIWMQLKTRYNFDNQHWKQLWAITSYERLRLRCILDAVVAHLYGLSEDDFRWILRDCDHSIGIVNDKAQARKFDPKGFWRVDKDKPPELRHTVLTQIAFHDLQTMGLEAFLSLNNGEGWMLPETLRLSDYGLGTDDRARMPQPVAEVLGDRFLPWQLEGTIEDSWAECEKHAALLKRLLGIPEPISPSNPTQAPLPPADPNFQQPTDLFGNPLETDLFGNIIEPPKKRKRK